jgi:hypothetical protein
MTTRSLFRCLYWCVVVATMTIYAILFYLSKDADLAAIALLALVPCTTLGSSITAMFFWRLGYGHTPGSRQILVLGLILVFSPFIFLAVYLLNIYAAIGQVS